MGRQSYLENSCKPFSRHLGSLYEPILLLRSFSFKPRKTWGFKCFNVHSSIHYELLYRNVKTGWMGWKYCFIASFHLNREVFADFAISSTSVIDISLSSSSPQSKFSSRNEQRSNNETLNLPLRDERVSRAVENVKSCLAWRTGQPHSFLIRLLAERTLKDTTKAGSENFFLR